MRGLRLLLVVGAAVVLSAFSTQLNAEPVTGVPLTVLDTMLRVNKGVKSCFVQYRNATGSLPSGRIPLKIRIQPDGVPDQAYIASGPYKLTDLDLCLSNAIEAIRFPPFAGEAKNYTYPFTLGSPSTRTAPAPSEGVPPPTQRISSSTDSAGVPLTVLDTLLRSNRGVKGCFVEYRNATGSLPSGRIPVKIRVQPSGSPDQAYISSGTYRDTSLDACLSRTIQDIKFPPFVGEAKNYTYPFTL
jgi:hypothetical protein